MKYAPLCLELHWTERDLSDNSLVFIEALNDALRDKLERQAD